MTIRIRIVIRILQAFCGCSHTNDSSIFLFEHRNSNRNIEETFVCERGVGSIIIVLFSFEKSQIWSMQALAEECGE